MPTDHGAIEPLGADVGAADGAAVGADEVAGDAPAEAPAEGAAGDGVASASRCCLTKVARSESGSIRITSAHSRWTPS
jgi:hypothetical protein